MKPRITLASRIFLFSFISICVVSASGFWALNEALKNRIKDHLKSSLQINETFADAAAARYRERSIQLLAALSENAGLKAAMGLLREIPHGRGVPVQVQKTIEATLFELGRGLDYQVMVVSDYTGRPVAGSMNQEWGITPLSPLPEQIEGAALVEIKGKLYETITVPINLGQENIGALTVGRRMELASWNPSGQMVLLRNGRIRETTFADSAIPALEAALRSDCIARAEGCEVRIGKENYLALPLTSTDWGKENRLVSLQSLDAATNEFSRGLGSTFLWVGGLGTIAALLLSGAGSHSIAKPIRNLIAQLRAGQRSGRIEANFPVTSGVHEVNLLADALNEAARAVQDSQKRLEVASLEFLEIMARALDARDPYTAGHSDRVSANSTAIAQAMNLPPKEVEIIRIGAKMHDIGKIGIPDAVLQKPDKLTDEEFALIKLHPQIGKRILEKAGQFQDFLPIIELHHEDFDGGGYPYGLKGEEIPLGVRIVHVADVYDAITSDRAYRKAMPRKQVYEIMQSGAGTHFDPRVVDIFLKILREREALETVLEETVSAQVCFTESV